LIEIIAAFLATFLISWVICSHNALICKYVCPASLATLAALLVYVYLG
jgi:hypothetical protein